MPIPWSPPLLHPSLPSPCPWGQKRTHGVFWSETWTWTLSGWGHTKTHSWYILQQCLKSKTLTRCDESNGKFCFKIWLNEDLDLTNTQDQPVTLISYIDTTHSDQLKLNTKQFHGIKNNSIIWQDFALISLQSSYLTNSPFYDKYIKGALTILLLHDPYGTKWLCSSPSQYMSYIPTNMY